jgi:cytochrome c553
MRYIQTFKTRVKAVPASPLCLGIPACLLFVLLFGLNVSHAGMYHASKEETGGLAEEQLRCAQCHTMHGTQGGSSLIYGETGPPATLYAKLLRAASAYDLCLSCHGESPDVTSEGGLTPPKVVNGTSATYTPSAGDFKHNGSASNRNRHDIGVDVSSTEPPGYEGSNWNGAGGSYVTGKFGTTFNCIYCHDQHGNKNYRNLRYDPGTPDNDTASGGVSVTFSVYTASESNCSDGTSPACDARVEVSTGNLYKYGRDNVLFFKTSGEVHNRISEWCGRCHGDFYGKSGDADMGGIDDGGTDVGEGDNNTTGSPWKRHPVGDINILMASTTTNLHADATNWDRSTTTIRFADPDVDLSNDDDEQPFCLSCHYAHGGGNPNKTTDPELDHSMLVYTDTSGGHINLDLSGNYSASEGRMRNVCQECHNQ